MRWMIVLALVVAACETEADRRAKMEHQVRELERSAKEMQDVELKMLRDMKELKRNADTELAPMQRDAAAWKTYGTQAGDVNNRMVDAQMAAIDAKTPGERKAAQAKADELKAERDRLLAKMHEASTAPAPTQLTGSPL